MSFGFPQFFIFHLCYNIKVEQYNMADFPVYDFILWNICDIIGDSDKWSAKIRKLFWTKNVTHFNRFILCAFVYINGLNP